MRKALQTALVMGCAAVLAGSCAASQTPAPGESSNGVLRDPQQWRGLALAGALEAAADISDPYQRSRALAGIARTQALIEAGTAADATIRFALAAAEDIREDDFKGWALHDIVEAQIVADDPIGARATAERIAARRPQGAALALIAAMQLRGGNLDAAKATALRIREGGARDHVLWQLAAIQLLRGDRSAAWDTARLIRERSYHVRAYGDIAISDLRAGDLAGTDAAIARVRRRERPEIYARVALARAEQGDEEGALQALSRIDDVFHRGAALGRVVLALSQSAGVRGAAGEIAAAAAALERAPDKQQPRAGVLAQLARAQAASGDLPGARLMVQHALEAARDIPVAVQRDEAHDRIARVQVEMEEVEAAFATALRVSDEVSRALLVRDLVATEGGSRAALSVLQRPSFEADSLLAAAVQFGAIGVQLGRGDFSAARTNIAAARKTVAAIDRRYQPAALAALAGALVLLKDVPEGWDTLQDALRAAESITGAEQRSAAYVQIANALDDRLLFLGRPAE